MLQFLKQTCNNKNHISPPGDAGSIPAWGVKPFEFDGFRMITYKAYEPLEFEGFREKGKPNECTKSFDRYSSRKSDTLT